MSSHLAFELTEDFAEITGGSAAAPDGLTIDFMDLLAEGPTVVRNPTDGAGDLDLGDTGPEGVIVVADEFVKSLLDEHIAFKRTSIPDGWTPAGDELPISDELAKLNKTDLQALADRAGLDGVNKDEQTKPQMLHAMRPDDFPDPAAAAPPGPTPMEPDGTPIAAADDDSDDGQGE